MMEKEDENAIEKRCVAHLPHDPVSLRSDWLNQLDHLTLEHARRLLLPVFIEKLRQEVPNRDGLCSLGPLSL